MEELDNRSILQDQERAWWNPQELFSGSKAIWAIMLFLMSISLWIVFTSSSTDAFEAWYKGNSFFMVIGKHMIYMILAVVVCVLVSLVPLRVFRHFAPHLLILSVIPLVLVPFFGATLNDATRHLVIFGISFQPSELVRLTLINFTASRLRFKDGQHATPRNFFIIFVPAILICGVIAKDNISTAAILGAVVYIMALIGGANRIWMRRLFFGAIGGLVLLIIVMAIIPSTKDNDGNRLATGTARIERFVAQFGKPINKETYKHVNGVDQQIVAAQKAIANSHFIGTGLGKSEMRHGMLPEAFSDFVFSIIIEEGGILAAMAVILAYLALFFAAGGIGRKTTSVYQTLLVLGIGLIITLQAILHMMINVQLFPITGQNLPFISRGGSSYIVTGMYFGILLAVSKRNQERINKHLAEVSGNSAVVPEVVPEIEEIDNSIAQNKYE
ncbi:FtsW/RodA/SpoVE family cell cycle protein [Porphyromonas levii]|nr:FtsW/RodA/SpoVE family cell cycle protein [Porphyromonas levii]MBR8703880.1 putative peptidoglycan glycosyltransferase FtsW [Porphyromonas levii]MBR8712182.1 putative peptidoglycan glycosyltransferase FtsW [Porphyromonas levii]MBR8714352.1 putative peptidoglycan glycosyltransferase FtsW [Porphyromonas levii]MBR8726893.1 putative peptidoglycan glycosyltransferase FtsW [Porphyromonas levii]MBR8728714.1 putative peptidoglycan glycosyltransferase FtsW [Porphyromonas levii]